MNGEAHCDYESAKSAGGLQPHLMANVISMIENHGPLLIFRSLLESDEAQILR